MVRSPESASTPISAGGYTYQPTDAQDVADFANHTAAELATLAAEQGYDFSAHPAVDPGEQDWGILTAYETGRTVRPATSAEHARSLAAGRTGTFHDDELGTVFVAGGPES